jgi:hypothetical protein
MQAIVIHEDKLPRKHHPETDLPLQCLIFDADRQSAKGRQFAGRGSVEELGKHPKNGED